LLRHVWLVRLARPVRLFDTSEASDSLEERVSSLIPLLACHEYALLRFVAIRQTTPAQRHATSLRPSAQCFSQTVANYLTNRSHLSHRPHTSYFAKGETRNSLLSIWTERPLRAGGGEEGIEGRGETALVSRAEEAGRRL
jgi:hypothetical protein